MACRSQLQRSSPTVRSVSWFHTQKQGRQPLLAVILVMVALIVRVTPAYAEAALNVVQTLVTPGSTTVNTFDTVIYKIAISCNSSDDPHCLNVQITGTLDPNLDYVAASPPSGFSLQVSGNTYTVTATSPNSIESGSTLDMFLTARVDGTAPPNAAIPNTVHVALSNGPGNTPTIYTSTGPTLTVAQPSPKWSVDKVKLKPGSFDPPVDSNVSYGMKVCSNQLSGNVNLETPTIIDDYPAGVTVIKTDGGTDDGDKITWHLSTTDLALLYPPGVPPSTKVCITKKVVLRYPSPTFAVGQQVTNRMELSSSTLPSLIVDTLTHGFSEPNPSFVLTKGAISLREPGNEQISPGMVQTWRLTADANAGNFDIANPIITDTLPIYDSPGMIESTLVITSGLWDPTINAYVEVSSDGSNWTLLGGTPVDGDDNKTWLAPTDFAVNITHVRWRFYQMIGASEVYSVEADFIATGMNIAQKVANSATPGSTFTNCGNSSTGSQSCKTITIVAPRAELEPEKTALSQPKPGDNVQFSLMLKQGPDSTLEIVDPSMTDIISNYMEFVSWDSASSEPPGLAQPYLISTTLPDGSLRLRWYWSSSAPVNGSVNLTGTTPSNPNPISIPLGPNYVEVKFTARVKPATPWGDYPNSLYTDAAGAGETCEVVTGDYPNNVTPLTESSDINGDGVTDSLCKDTATVTVLPAVIILSQKWIKGDSPEDSAKPNVDQTTLAPPTAAPCPSRVDVGDGFTRVPCVAQTDRGDIFTYTLRLENAGNISVTDYILYDVLPFTGDRGVSEILAGFQRGTKWRPVMTGPIVPDGAPANAVIEYSDSSNSCRPEMNAGALDGAWQTGCVNDWTTTPDVWGDVRSFRIKIPFAAPDYYLPGQRIYFRMKMYVPSGAPQKQIAWNALAQRATNAVNNERLLAAEPPKVGIYIPAQSPIFDLALQKRLADGQPYIIHPNRDVTFTLTITNQGDITASEVSLVDYFPQTFTLSPNESNWTGGAGNATRTLTGLTFAPGDELSVNIILRASDVQVGVYTNTAEIASAKSITGATLSDVDSTPDSTNNESLDVKNNATGATGADGLIDAMKDDASEEDGKNILGADEDDHDIATVQLVMVAIGNRVWFDTGAGAEMDNGKLDVSEVMSGAPGVQLQLYRLGDSPGSSLPVSTTTTIAGGYYQFDKLEPGQYFVHIPITNFLASGPLYRTVSSTGAGANETSDEQADENGINASVAGGISSNVFDLQPFAEPLSEDYETKYTGVLTDANVNFTADFAFVPAVAIGNRIWKDTGDGNSNTTINNGKFDSGEQGMDGVIVELYDENNVLISTTTTSNGGYYYFDLLNPGQYYVKVSASEFADSAPLEGFFNSTGSSTDETTDQSADENGIDEAAPWLNGVRTNLFDLQPFSEQTSEAQTHYTGTLLDASVNATADLGFWEPLRLGNRVWIDDGRASGVPNDGRMNGAEPGVSNVVLALRDQNDAAVMNMLTGQPYTTTTDANGFYIFTNLLPGTYKVFIPAANFSAGQPLQGYSSSTPDNDANNTTDTDDNGINNPDPTANGISSGNVILAFGTEPTTDLSDEGGFKNTNSNLTVDFGFVSYDRGDLPDGPYATLLANSGADHAITPDLYFGSIVDAEYDGQPNSNANGDDNAGSLDDEDGIVFLTPFMPGTTATISMTAHVTPGITAFYAAFIDFNGDGDFTDTGEKITGSVTDGLNTLNVPVPTVVSDTIYSRFRIALVANEIATPTGLANSGEVEDYLLMSLGNQVWLDNGAGVKSDANDGELDAGEQGIAGVTVTLALSGTNTPIATTTTDANGHYTFTGLLPSDYQVIIAAENFQSGGLLYNHASTLTTESDPNNDGDKNDNGIENGNPTVNGISSNGITLAPSSEPMTDGNGNQSNLTVDFGFVKYDLGDLPDVGAGTGTGNYQTLLSDDGARHLIDAGLFLGASFDAELDGQPSSDANGDDTTGSPDDEDGVTFVSPIRPGQVATLTVVASMAGYLNAWIDFNGDGVMAAGEKLFGDDRALSSGTNTLTFTVPGSITDTLYSRFRFTSNTSEALEPTGIATNGEVEDYVTHLYSLGNRVWIDWNNDGQQNGTEAGIANVAVELYAADANGDPTRPVILTDTTDANGYYLFDALLAGNYVVVIPASNFSGVGELVNFVSSTPDEANADSNGDTNDNGLGGEPDVSNGIRSSKLTLGDTSEPSESDLGVDGHGSVRDANSNLTVDFGFWQPLSLGNRLWYDTNNDGQIDGGEVGVAGVVVSLRDNSGSPVISSVTGLALTTITSVAGYYTFTDLISGTYQVLVDAINFQPAGVLQNYVSSDPTTATPDNDEDKDDNGLNPTTPASYPVDGVLSGPITVIANQEPTNESDPVGSTLNDNWTVDFGFYKLSVGDLVWKDTNNNGEKEADEPVLSAITVTLLSTNGTVISQTVTDGNGLYTFTNLVSGTYAISITPPAGYVSSTPTETTDGINDKDHGVPSGVYVVSAPFSLTAAGVNEASDNATGGSENKNLDFGLWQPLSLGNRVWLDENSNDPNSPDKNDGVMDASEAGVAAVLVALFDSNGNPVTSTVTGLPITTMTDAGGFYTFTNLISGIYKVRITLPVGYISSDDPATGADPNNDTDGDDNGVSEGAGYVESAPITLITGTEPTNEMDDETGAIDANSNLSVDFGLWRPLNLGNQVWYDSNNDGQINNSEMGVNDVKVELYRDSNGNGVYDAGDRFISTTTTANGGYYTFTNLLKTLTPTGAYLVVITSTNFVDGAVLDNYVSSDAAGYEAAADPDNDLDDDDNGTWNSALGLIASKAITLTEGSEPNRAELDGDSNWTVDFGVYQLTVGDLVWNDLDNDGMKDSNEAPLSGVTVTLVSANGSVIAETVTDGSGIYTFTGLISGTYVISVTPPMGYVSSTPTTNSDGGNGTDHGAPNGNAIVSQPFALTPGGALGTNESGNNPSGATENKNLDFGLWQPLSLGNRVWLDENSNDPNSPDKNDGVLDASESGVAGVVVTLLDGNNNPVTSTVTGLPITTTTDAGGFYTFTNLISETYIVRITLPAGYASSDEPTSGADPNNGTDGDDNGVTEAAGYVQSTPITLIASTEPITETEEEVGAIDANSNLSVDFGLWRPLNLGNQVWYDTNNDGLLNNNEVGVNDVVVELYRDRNGDGVFDLGDTLISTTTTANGGYYTFTRLLKTLTPTGAYLVVITNTNFADGQPLADYVSSDAAGYETPGVDPDNDQDGDDNGVTDNVSGVIASQPISLTEGSEPNRAELDGDSNWTVDFGVYKLGVGDLVWIDTDNDGLKDNNEAPISGVTVTLLSASGQVIAETVTDNSGLYTFTGIVSGTYVVSITPGVSFGPGYVSSTPTTTDDGSNGTDHGTPSGAFIVSQPFNLTPGGTSGTNEAVYNPTGASENKNLDFGLTPLYSLGNRVWFDTNNDGDIDNSEIGVTGILVNLLDSSGNPVLDGSNNPITATTDGDGYYRFDNLLAGDYQVEIAASNFADGAVLKDYFGSTPTEGDANDDNDSNDNGLSDVPNVTTGVRSGIVTLGADEQLEPTSESDLSVSGQGAVKDEYANMTVDFGFYTMTLGNQVWIDLDNNGTMDGNETGLPGVPVSVTNLATGEVFTAATDSDGYYTVTGLISGTYVVSVTAPPGYVSSLPDAGDPDSDVDDGDDNGVGSTGDVIASQPITLIPGRSANGSTVMDGNGSTVNPRVDFGLTPLYSLGNRVWFDTNNDGDIDNSEVGVAGVLVNLLDSNGDPMLDAGDAPISATTDSNGHYRFDNLLAGDYQVEIAADNFASGAVLDDYFGSTPTESDPNDDGDSNDNGLSDEAAALTGVRSDIVTLGGAIPEPSDEADLSATDQGAAEDEYANMTVDFGFYTLTLGNQVWIDLDNNGRLDGNESGLPGVPVTVTNLESSETFTTTTDGNGYYTVTGLISGTYEVSIMTPVGYVSSTPDAGDPDSDVDDSDDNGVGALGGLIASQPIVLLPGDSENGSIVTDPAGSAVNLKVDFGLTPLYSLGNRVWFDTNNDGNIGNNEVGVAGVVVNLLDGNGEPLLNGSGNPMTTTTDSNGHYRFDNLLAGDYLVEIAASNFANAGVLKGYFGSTPTESNPNSDGDSNDNGLVDVANALTGVRSGIVTLGADETTEPMGETDLSSSGQGAMKDEYANMTVDFGFYTLSLGNQVWFDVDNDGLFGTGESPLAGVSVRLLDGNGNPLLDGNNQPLLTTTDASGKYSFTHLISGTYIVEVMPPAGYRSSTSDENNPNGNGDSNDNGVSIQPNGAIRSNPVSLLPGDGGATNNNIVNSATSSTTNPTVDFGLWLPASLGNYIWLDEDADGQQDAGEPGIPNVLVVTVNDKGQTFTTTTDSQGGYLFDELPPGTYTVTIPAENFQPGKSLEGMDQTTLLGGQEDYGNKDDAGYSVTLQSGEENLTADFGYNPNPSGDVNNDSGLAALGDHVWIDSDGDGAQDANETPVSGVEVTLYIDLDGNGVYDTVVRTDVTDVNGNYLFSDLPSGAYVVKVTNDDNASHPILEVAQYAQTGDPDHFGTTGSNNDNLSKPVVLAPGDLFLNVDFGYQPTANTHLNSVGDTVYFDADADGNGPTQPAVDGGASANQGLGAEGDAVDYGIAGVIVALVKDLNGNGAWEMGEPIIATDMTDAKGQYLFSSLADGKYIVVITDSENVLDGLRPTWDKDDGLITPDEMSAVDLDSARSNANSVDDRAQDFGYTPKAQQPGLGAIGDTIWLNVNGDNAQTANEPGIEGVIIKLTLPNGTVLTTVTDENGHYYFGGLPLNAQYTVTVAPENFQPGGVLEGLQNSADKEGDKNNTTISAVLTAGSPIDLTNDLGYTPAGQAGRIGNLVWLDSNADGDFDGINGPDGLAGTDDDEPVIAGVTVDLYRDLNGNGLVDAGEPRIATTVTTNTLGAGSNGVDGNYIFEGLPTSVAGIKYLVVVSDREAVLNGYWKSEGPNDGSNNNSQPIPYSVSLTRAAPENLTADFGYYVEPASLGNYVWFDQNHNGIQDVGEQPLQGVTVTLTIAYLNGVTTTLTTQTDGNGHYEFNNLLLDEDDTQGSAAGNPVFAIAVATPAGYAPTLVDVSGNSLDKQDSDNHSGVVAIPSKGFTDVAAKTPVTNEGVIASYDFGFWQPLSLGNLLWLDDGAGGGVRNDGIRNGSEVPAPQGVVVELLNITGTVMATTTTDRNGYYRFDNLLAGEYMVRIPASEFMAGGKLLGYESSTNQTTTFATGDNNRDHGDDVENDGVISSKITLTASNPTAEKDAAATGAGDNGTLGDLYDNLTVDFGLVPPLFSLGNQVWNDANNNGLKEQGEAGIKEIVVKLYRDSNNDGQPDGAAITETTTNPDGLYLFSNLLPDTYIVEITAPAGYVSSTPDAGDVDSDADDSDDNGVGSGSGVIRSAPITLVLNGEPTGETPDNDSVTLDGNENLTVDFGLWQPLSLGNLVWYDKNNNGQVDSGEPGIPAVMVQLFKKGDNPATAIPLSTTTTLTNGHYLFSGLLAGEYFVYIATPPAFYPLSSTPTDTNDNGEDNDDNGSQAQPGQPVSSPLINLQPGVEPTSDGDGNNGDLTIDFGFTKLASLGDLVWLDVDQDGVQDAVETGTPGASFEKGIPGVLVTLFKADGTKVAETRTGTDGRYLFDDLIPGDYYVQFVMPASYTLTGQNLGDNDAFDSDVDAVTLRTPVTNLSAGEHDPTLDMGVHLPDGVKPASIGDRVWYDTDKDGIQDAGETGVPGVTVELHRSDGSLVATTMTDANGNYQFNSLPPGDYYTQIVPTTGYQISPADQGGNDLTDSDVNVIGQSPVTTLVSGENDPTWDAGLFLPNPPASLGNIVWYDLDADGVQDADETGVPGVTVNLYDANGKLLTSMVTSSDGKYLFNNLAPGQYVVEFVPPAEYVLTGQDLGGDNGLDSDANPSNGRTVLITLTSGQADMSWDAGVYILGEDGASATPPSGVGNRVWEDEDRDGIQDAGEAALPGVTVKLYNAAGELIATTKTDNNGNYSFPNLPPGQYFVEFVAPEGYSISPLGTGSTSDADSNVSHDTGRTVIVTLGTGQTDITWDAGFFKTPTALEEGEEPTLNQKVFLPVIGKE